jgi:hypothetical protein
MLVVALHRVLLALEEGERLVQAPNRGLEVINFHRVQFLNLLLGFPACKSALEGLRPVKILLEVFVDPLIVL